jgi:DNA-binding NtrC family response regulator
MLRLTAYTWPGNMRQLNDVLSGVLVRLPGNVIGPEHLPLDTFAPASMAG